MKAQFPLAFHDVTNGNNSVPCATTAVSGGISPAKECVAVSGGLQITDGTYGATTEGQLQVNGKAAYSAGAGYNLATGLGTIDANVLVTNWGKVTFKSTSTTLTASQTSFAHGTAITISGSVTGSTTPTGNVALMSDSTLPAQAGVGVFPLDSKGSFSDGSVNYLPGGTYNIWGQYSGDGTNAASTSAKTQITVTPEDSTAYFTVLNSSNSSSALGSGATQVPYGTQLILDTRIYGTNYYNQCIAAKTPPTSCSTTPFTAPTGTVTFADNGTTINTAVLNSEGDAEYNAPFSVGTHSVTSSYAGDASYNKSSSAAFTFTIVQNTPNIVVGASNMVQGSATINLTGGQAGILNVLIENSGSSSQTSTSTAFTTPVAPPTGTVTISGLPSGNGTATLVGGIDPAFAAPAGVAAFTIPANTKAGTYNVNISYAGDANYAAVSGSGTVAILSSSKRSSSITANTSGSLSPRSSITVTGTVTGSGTTAPTGNVYVYSGGNYVTQFPLGKPSGNASPFSGTLNSQMLTPGNDIVALQYSGDNTYNGSAVALNSGTPISNPLSDFTLTANPSVAVKAGGSGTTSVYVTPVNGFSGSVGLSCAVQGAPSGVSCSLDQSSVSLTYSQTAGLAGQEWRRNLLASGGGAALACVLLLVIPARRRAWRNMLGLVLFACIAGMGIGCGGSGTAANLGPITGGGGSGSGGNGGGGTGGNTGPGTAANPSTPVTLTVNGAAAGDYRVVITGTSTATNQIHTLGITAQVR